MFDICTVETDDVDNDWGDSDRDDCVDSVQSPVYRGVGALSPNVFVDFLSLKGELNPKGQCSSIILYVINR